MKMSKKTRLVSIIMCIALMMGIMSASMMASAANSETPAIAWKTAEAWAKGDLAKNDGYAVVSNGYTEYGQCMIGGWGKTVATLKTSSDATGIAFAIRVDAATGTGGTVRALNAFFKFCLGGAWVQTSQNIPMNTTTQVVLPFADFAQDGGGSTVIDATTLATLTDVQMGVNTYGDNAYWGNQLTGVKFSISDVYVYTDTAEAIALPDDNQEPSSTEPSTAAPTTEAPTTEAPTTEAPTTEAPTTQAVVTEAPTTAAPTTVAPVVTAKKPAKVKGVKVTVGKKKITVKCNKAKNAKKYVVKYSYKKNMKGAKTKTTAKTKLVIKKLKTGKKVYVQVQGVNGKVKGSFSAKKVSKKIK